MNSIDQQFIEYIVKSLVGNPDAVKIERRIDEKGVLLELTVDPEDLGRVIGKRGATAQSLRTLLRALGTKNDARYNLKIIDNGVAPNRRSEEPTEVSPTPETPETPESVPGEVGDSAADEPLPEDSEEPEPTPVDEPEAAEPEEDVLSKTRKELDEFDDLDI